MPPCHLATMPALRVRLCECSRPIASHLVTVDRLGVIRSPC
ncbi:hypothetical protein QUA46_08920 [Microcoleus sp. MON2_D6]